MRATGKIGKARNAPKGARVAGPRAYHHGDLRGALMQAALKAIEQDGVSNVSLRALAQEAGVSHSAPAHHFRDRVGLLTALAIAGYDRLLEELHIAAHGSGEPHTRASALIGAYVQFAIEHRAHFEAMFWPGLHSVQDAELLKSRAKVGQLFRDAIDRESPCGARDQDVAITHPLAIAHGVSSLVLSGVVSAPIAANWLTSLAAR